VLTAALFILNFAPNVPAQRPVILSFQSDGLLTWSNAYPNAIALVERLSDVVTIGAVTTVTETLGISDGSTAIYSHTVAHSPIVSPSVTISDGTYSWNDVTGSSSPANFLGTVSSYASGQVSAIYLSTPAATGTVIEVDYSYRPLSTNQEWLSVYSAHSTSQVMQTTVDMSEEMALFRVMNIMNITSLSNMEYIPAGSFTMGNCMDPSEGDSGELPLHTVYVSAFYMDKYEVTKELWDEVKAWNGGNGYSYDYAGASSGTNNPVMNINWYDVVKWCNARSQKDGLTPCYYADAGLTVLYKTGQVAPYVKWDANGYRLPTEAEWEKAARGGLSGQRFPWGNTIDESQANYRSLWSGGEHYYSYDVSTYSGYNPLFNGSTSPVGYFAPNGYGVYDMAGNVWEWCWDWYSSSYYSSPPASNPHNDTPGSKRVIRGGSMVGYAEECRAARRGGYTPSVFSYNIGFRCVRNAE